MLASRQQVQRTVPRGTLLRVHCASLQGVPLGLQRDMRGRESSCSLVD